MVADTILNGEDIRGLFLLTDNCAQDSLLLFNIYCEKLKQKNYTVHIINPTRPDLVPSTVASNVWPPPLKLSQPQTVIAIHSIEVLLALSGTDFTTAMKQIVTWLGSSNVNQVICGLNTELSSSEDRLKLEYLSSQCIKVLRREDNSFEVITVWKKPRGKTVSQKELLGISEGRIVKCEEIKEPVPVEQPKPQTTNLLADLTFSVTISDEEKKAKENLVLPYTEVGQITYTLDREDDFDEEDDPDDDLEI